MTPAVDEKALITAHKALNREISIDWMRKCVQAYLARAPQPDSMKFDEEDFQRSWEAWSLGHPIPCPDKDDFSAGYKAGRRSTLFVLAKLIGKMEGMKYDRHLTLREMCAIDRCIALVRAEMK